MCLKKVYLVGFTYDDFRSCGYRVVDVYDTVEKALAKAKALEDRLDLWSHDRILPNDHNFDFDDIGEILVQEKEVQ